MCGFYGKCIVMGFIVVLNTELGQGLLRHWRAALPFRGTSPSYRGGTTGPCGAEQKQPLSLSPGVEYPGWYPAVVSPGYPSMSSGLGSVYEEELDESAAHLLSLQADRELSCAGRSMASKLKEAAIPPLSLMRDNEWQTRMGWVEDPRGEKLSWCNFSSPISGGEDTL